jgi:hypothetical protein
MILRFRAGTEKFRHRNKYFQTTYENFRDDSGMIGSIGHLKQMEEENKLFSGELRVCRSEARSLSLVDRHRDGGRQSKDPT